MGVPHVTSVCFCLGLELGSKMIGFLHMSISLIMLGVWALFAESCRGYMRTLEDEDNLYSVWFKVAVGTSVLCAGHALLAAALLYSVFKRRAAGLRVWVCAMCVLYVAALLYVVVELALSGPSGSGSEIFLSFLQGAVFFAAVAYAILCVNSYYMMLRSAQDMEGPGKTLY